MKIARGYTIIVVLLESRCLLVQNNTQERSVNVQPAIILILNEAQFSEFIHEKIDPGARCPDHFRQHLLRYLGKHFLRLVLLAIASEQKEGAGQPFLAGVKELIDQILLDSDVPRKHISHEAVGERTFSVENANHLLFFNKE